ncbi:MAG: hypothetical protein MK179_21905, partial [Pirellulaceae bacterium]|nr:hypothetical protein [Pirellulaceae bacterium]
VPYGPVLVVMDGSLYMRARYPNYSRYMECRFQCIFRREWLTARAEDAIGGVSRWHTVSDLRGTATATGVVHQIDFGQNLCSVGELSEHPLLS